MPLPQTTQDRWQTAHIVLQGGITDNSDELTSAAAAPGSLATGINYEAGLRGGYRRINGYVPFDSAAPTGTGAILGLTVFPDAGVIAGRNAKVFFSGGSGWSQINSDSRTAPTKLRFAHFNFGFEKVIGVDNVNQPFTWDGTTYTVLADAPSGSFAYAFNNYMFIAQGSLLNFSAPADETDWDGTDGAGVFNVGFNIVGMASWRDTLYIFGENRISALTGTIFGGGTPDANLQPVTTNIGCVAPDSIIEISGDVLYLAADGIRTISGTTRIGDVELAAITDPVHKLFVDFISQYAFSNFSACAVPSKNQYRLFAANTGNMTAASQGWLTCVRGTSYSYTGATNNWEHYQLQGINAFCSANGYINEVEFVVHGSFDGHVYRQEQGNSFNGAPITHQLRLPYNGFDDPELRKTFYKLKTNIIAEGDAHFNVQLSFDYGANTSNQPAPMMIGTTSSSGAYYGSGVYGTSIYNSTTNPDFYNYAIGSGLNMALVYSGNDATSAPFTIRSVVMDYQVNGRR